MKSSALIVLLTCLTICVASLVHADGPPRNLPKREAPSVDYASTALDAYGNGYAFIERATRFDQDAAAAEDEKARSEAREGARQAYEDALHAFEEAVRLDERMYEAYTYIGYANRKLGRHDQALEAHRTALRLKPDYARAIQYQGEAYLGLDRFADAKFNYQRLYALDAEQAKKLLAAMHKWVQERARDPRSVSRDELTAASEWLDTQPHTPLEAMAEGSTPW